MADFWKEISILWRHPPQVTIYIQNKTHRNSSTILSTSVKDVLAHTRGRLSLTSQATHGAGRTFSVHTEPDRVRAGEPQCPFGVSQSWRGCRTQRDELVGGRQASSQACLFGYPTVVVNLDPETGNRWGHILRTPYSIRLEKCQFCHRVIKKCAFPSAPF